MRLSPESPMTATRRRGYRQAVVVGAASLPFAKDIGLTERAAGARAILAALDDAGLSPSDVDGMTRYSWEPTTEIEIARILGVPNLRYFGCVDYGGGASTPVVNHAAMAIELGLADVVVVWRARNRGSGGRPWTAQLLADGQDQFERPMGLVRAVDGMAIHTRHWMHTLGWTREDLGRIAVTQRNHAMTNPDALMRRPLSLDDYMTARWIAEPLCLFDCCLESDGALAIVLTSAERAADLDVQPAYVTGYAQGTGPDSYGMTFWHGDQLGQTPSVACAPELWRNTGLTPADIDVVQIYDAFTPEVLVFWDEYGFCSPGESPAFLRDGANPPYNTSGGSLSEAYVHGFNLVVEAVRQVRGTAPNQVPDVAHSMVNAGNVCPTGAIVFSKEPS